MGVIGNLAMYQHYQLGHAMPIAAANPAGGLAGAGVGLGMGMAMAGPMLPGAPQPPAPGPQAPPPPPPPAPSFHVAQNGQRFGPYAADHMARLAAEGRLRPDSLVWAAGMETWTPAAQVPQLAALFPPEP